MYNLGTGSIIGIIILFGFIILVLTGLGILTKAIFSISSGTASDINQSIMDYISTNYPNVQLPTGSQIPTIPNSISTGDYIINLAGADLIVSKISLITFWILIAIMFVGLLSSALSDY